MKCSTISLRKVYSLLLGNHMIITAQYSARY